MAGQSLAAGERKVRTPSSDLSEDKIVAVNNRREATLEVRTETPISETIFGCPYYLGHSPSLACK